MINYNGKIIAEQELKIGIKNRAFKYGDALFETLKVIRNRVIFAEDHYFRLMASMRMLRMQIPMHFTLEFFEQEILKLVTAKNLGETRVRFTVYRADGGLYLPQINTISYVIEGHPLQPIRKETYEIDIFKDYYVNSDLLSTLKTNNKILNVVGSIYAEENGLDNCVLINEHKFVVEVLNANIFLVKDNVIRTPALSQGCLKGIIRKKIIEVLKRDDLYSVEETEVSPFDLQKADEIFISNSIIDIQPVTKYRKKTFNTGAATYLQQKLKALERLD